MKSEAMWAVHKRRCAVLLGIWNQNSNTVTYEKCCSYLSISIFSVWGVVKCNPKPQPIVVIWSYLMSQSIKSQTYSFRKKNIRFPQAYKICCLSRTGSSMSECKNLLRNIRHGTSGRNNRFFVQNRRTIFHYDTTTCSKISVGENSTCHKTV